jgi:hypothetical protein
MDRAYRYGLTIAGFGLFLPPTVAWILSTKFCEAASVGGAFLATGCILVISSTASDLAKPDRGLLLGGANLICSWLLAAVLVRLAAADNPGAAGSFDTDSANVSSLAGIATMYGLATTWTVWTIVALTYFRIQRRAWGATISIVGTGLILAAVGVCAGVAPWGVMDPAGDCAASVSEIMAQSLVGAVPAALALSVLATSVRVGASSKEQKG